MASLKQCIFQLLQLSALVSTAAIPAVPNTRSPVRIMPFGASIVGGDHSCWRAKLWSALESAGYTNFNFVGTLDNHDCGVWDFDGSNEGHSGFLATDVAHRNELVEWLADTNPEVIIEHIGTNDVIQGKRTSDIIDAYSTLVMQMRQNNPNMKMIFSELLPLDPSVCDDCDQKIVDLNAAIRSWAPRMTRPESPIFLVDLFEGMSAANDLVDGIHPNESGQEKIATRLIGPVEGVLRTFNNRFF
ncbi:SGNH hydrolase-type esterase domain-containing protein [Lineolata rhizophorae]|uniref:SGNH hydrolase-type esterase domain-containing protein n=1 Tax=Lineolata rhizophorae TaxID=578093 RepID=A0A6A6NWF0_9PEZI|nr:SGNH hydrolase-type esterase domain-containing protein [Lineolata rhizophorae]